MNSAFDNIDIDHINLIFIHPKGKSGSVFMQSLLDNHQQISVIPFFGSFYSSIPKHIKDIDIDKAIDQFIDKYPSIFDTSKGWFSTHHVSGVFGENYDKHIKVDIGLFKENFHSLLSKFSLKSISRKIFLIILHLSYNATYRDVSHIKYIVYHLHGNISSPDFNKLLIDFPLMKFIAMLRHPIGYWNGCKKINVEFHKYRNPTDNIKLLHAIYRSEDYMYNIKILNNLILNGKDVKIIDLIDLHQDHKEIIPNISQWLEIEESEHLYQSTFCGLKWAGNRSDKHACSTFYDKKEDYSLVTKNEFKILYSDCYKEVYQRLGYDLSNIKPINKMFKMFIFMACLKFLFIISNQTLLQSYKIKIKKRCKNYQYLYIPFDLFKLFFEDFKMKKKYLFTAYQYLKKS